MIISSVLCLTKNYHHADVAEPLNRNFTPKTENEVIEFQVRCQIIFFCPLLSISVPKSSVSAYWLNTVYCAAEEGLISKSPHGQNIGALYWKSKRWPRTQSTENTANIMQQHPRTQGKRYSPTPVEHNVDKEAGQMESGVSTSKQNLKANIGSLRFLFHLSVWSS